MNEPQLSKVLRDRAAKLYDPNENKGDRDTAELLCCLARMVAGRPVEKAFGAPGDWGYGTEIGDALRDLYKSPMSALELIQRERLRTKDEKDWCEAEDDRWVDGSLAKAASCYASTAAIQSEKNLNSLPPCFVHKDWPWSRGGFKPADGPLRNAVIAGSYILSEIERLLRKRAAEKPTDH